MKPQEEAIYRADLPALDAGLEFLLEWLKELWSDGSNWDNHLLITPVEKKKVSLEVPKIELG